MTAHFLKYIYISRQYFPTMHYIYTFLAMFMLIMWYCCMRIHTFNVNVIFRTSLLRFLIAGVNVLSVFFIYVRILTDHHFIQFGIYT